MSRDTGDTVLNTSADVEPAVCRGCGRVLKGKAYYLGGIAYHPVTNERCPVNFYGGYACSHTCDYRSSLELERSMPGGRYDQQSLSTFASNSLRNNWGGQ